MLLSKVYRILKEQIDLINQLVKYKDMLENQ